MEQLNPDIIDAAPIIAKQTVHFTALRIPILLRALGLGNGPGAANRDKLHQAYGSENMTIQI
mgnify:CR=1 FL=1